MNISKFASVLDTSKKELFKHVDKEELEKDNLSVEQMRSLAEKMEKAFQKT